MRRWIAILLAMLLLGSAAAAEVPAGRWVRLLQDSPVFIGTYDYARHLMQAQTGDSFKATGTRKTTDGLTWVRVATSLGEGWLPETVVEVCAVRGKSCDADGLAGGMCSIIVNSGVVRTAPGQENDPAGTVLAGESYAILDAAHASTGTVWYKIDCSGAAGWVSSGMCELK